MAKLQIQVSVRGDRTVSKFRLGKTDAVVFRNAHQTDTLTVKVTDDSGQPSGALCDSTGNVTTFTVAPKAKMNFSVCPGFTGDSFKYSAQIGTAALEDPIVIIEPNAFVDNTAVLVGGAAVIGFLAGYFVSRLTKSGPGRPTG
jgi:hypothetical protein